MRVKTAELKNNLSKYLRRVREKGETIIVCDRDEPVATLSPFACDKDEAWQRRRQELLAMAKKGGYTIRVPEKRPVMPMFEPTVAPDGRTDINTVEEMRKERDY